MTPFAGTDWEDLAQREPYFCVLTDEGAAEVASNRERSTAFFETGEADVASLFEAIGALRGCELRPEATLDFGCGAGRLTVALARRSGTITGCDIAPTMLLHARDNLERAGFGGVVLLDNEALDQLPPRRFDFICSLLVFQYLPRAIGEPLVGSLVRVLAPGGVAAIHLLMEDPASRRRRELSFLREGWRRGSPGAVEGKPGLRLYRYDQRQLVRGIGAAGARLAACLPLRGEGAGVVLVIEKSAS